MMRNVLLFTIANSILLAGMVFYKQKATSIPTPVPVVIQQPVVEAVKPIEVKEEPKVEKVSFPRYGATTPGCYTYTPNSNGAFSKGMRLKDISFGCKVIKELKNNNLDFFLIEIQKHGYQKDIYIVDKTSVFDLADWDESYEVNRT